LVVFLTDEASAGGEGSYYTAAPESALLPGATGYALTRLVAEGLTLDRRVWRRGVREWAREPG
jgi:hypothetical protein